MRYRDSKIEELLKDCDPYIVDYVVRLEKDNRIFMEGFRAGIDWWAMQGNNKDNEEKIYKAKMLALAVDVGPEPKI